MAKQRRCGKCKQQLAQGVKMKEHWQAEHAAELAAIQRWLGESDAKIKTHEILAQDGMRGPGEPERGIK